ncbi:MAG: DUF4476 domain-containing protein [Paludibacteraceae bacterium]|nr:DUF4476 domain-containing protein [Paludibacteraceae bacterium]
MRRIVFVLSALLFSFAGYPQSHEMRPPHRGDRHPRIVCVGEENAGLIAETLHGLSFSEQKMKVAKMCVKVMPLCTRDLRLIVAEFDYDNDRLEYLKYAYGFVSDPWNYYTLQDCFSFQTNYNSLMDYVNGQRR